MSDYNEMYEKYSRYHVTEYPVRHKKKNMANVNVKVCSDSREKILEIRKMDERLGGMILSFNDYAQLVSDAHASNVHWTTKIEGNKLSLEEVRKSSRTLIEKCNKMDEIDPGPRQEILNHLYSYFLKKELALPWNLETVSAIHRMLMEGTGEKCIPGEIRMEEEMHVMTEQGQESFIASPPSHVKKELSALLEWLESSPFDPIVTAILFFHEFESIHPFTDGNGRVGRSLFHLLMQEFGFRNFNLCMIDVKLLGNTGTYYSLMEYTDKTSDYTPIVGFFIDCIHLAYEEALKSFSEKDLLKDLDENTKKIATMARSRNDWFFLSDVNRWIPGLSDQTIRAKLEELIANDLLEKDGRTRSMRYRFRDPFRELKKHVSEKYVRDE